MSSRSGMTKFKMILEEQALIAGQTSTYFIDIDEVREREI